MNSCSSICGCAACTHSAHCVELSSRPLMAASVSPEKFSLGRTICSCNFIRFHQMLSASHICSKVAFRLGKLLATVWVCNAGNSSCMVVANWPLAQRLYVANWVSKVFITNCTFVNHLLESTQQI